MPPWEVVHEVLNEHGYPSPRTVKVYERTVFA